MKETAIVLAEGFFGTGTAKTALGLVRHSERFQILGVIDSRHAGKDAGRVLDGLARGIPIFKDVKQAISKLDKEIDWLVVGVATVGGRLPETFRKEVRAALESGISVISGLHQYLGDEPEFKKAAKKGKARIVDIRRPPPLHELHFFRNLAVSLDCLRIPVMGTDSSIGKRTTAIELVMAFNRNGIPAVLVATGQTGLLQGARYGLALDGIMGDYMVGELENQILLAYEKEHPKVIVIEGQGSISHPAYVCCSRAILSASKPTGLVLQHAPARQFRHYQKDELHLPMPDLENEMRLLEAFSGAKTIAITINDTGMKPGELDNIIEEYELKYKVPAMNPLTQGCGKIVAKIEEILTE